MSSTKRIAKNTIFLYFRMMLIMAVQLYTVRVVLSVLGSTDYGLNNVIAGIVSMFSFLSSTMATASQRYFAFDIGKGDHVQLKKTFSLTLIIYCMLAVVILLLGETIGVWFLNNKLVIPPDRLVAANWVFQFAIFSFMLTMFQVPYDALVIAREKMNVYAYVSILEVILKLLIVYLLTISSFDKLITYSFLSLCITLIITTIYKIYCLKNYKESHFEYFWDQKLFKEVTSYSSWNLFGALAGIMNNQGINIMLNIFFGPTVNAARAVAYQINTSINGFVQNFMTATKPQITKYYAQNEQEKMLDLVFKSAKFSFFLLFVISFPIMIELPYILGLWLKTVPDYTVLFTRIIIITTLIDTLSYPLMASFQASGKVKVYQAVVGCLMLMNIPVSYLFLSLGYQPEVALYIVLVTSCVCLIIRLILLKRIINKLSLSSFFYKVLGPIIIIFFLAIIPTYIFKNTLNTLHDSMTTVLLIMISFFLYCISLIIIFGVSKSEKNFLLNMLKRKIK